MKQHCNKFLCFQFKKKIQFNFYNMFMFFVKLPTKSLFIHSLVWGTVRPSSPPIALTSTVQQNKTKYYHNIGVHLIEGRGIIPLYSQKLQFRLRNFLEPENFLLILLPNKCFQHFLGVSTVKYVSQAYTKKSWPRVYTTTSNDELIKNYCWVAYSPVTVKHTTYTETLPPASHQSQT